MCGTSFFQQAHVQLVIGPHEIFCDCSVHDQTPALSFNVPLQPDGPPGHVAPHTRITQNFFESRHHTDTPHAHTLHLHTDTRERTRSFESFHLSEQSQAQQSPLPDNAKPVPMTVVSAWLRSNFCSFSLADESGLVRGGVTPVPFHPTAF